MDPDHLAAWFEDHRPHFHDLARHIVGTRADADDVVQDAFLKALASLGEAIRSPAAWMTTTVRNLAFDHLRHRGVVAHFATHGEAGGGDDAPSTPSVEDGLVRRLEAAAAVMRIVQVLDEADAVALLLQIVFDEDHATLARRTGRSTGAMRVALHRARKRVRAEPTNERDRRSGPAQDRIAQSFAVCWQAIDARDAAVLHARLGSDPIAADDIRCSASAPPVRVSTVQHGGRYVLALRQGDRLICVLPIGVASSDSSCPVD